VAAAEFVGKDEVDIDGRLSGSMGGCHASQRGRERSLPITAAHCVSAEWRDAARFPRGYNGADQSYAARSMQLSRFIFLVTLLIALVAGSLKGAEPPSVLILYDNTTAHPDLQPNWGFAAQVLYRGHTILFDSGTKPDVLAANMRTLGVDPAAFEAGIFTHPHQDHLGGLAAVTQSRPNLTVYFLDTFPATAFTAAESLGAKPVRVTASRQIAPGLHSTGIVAGDPSEQALVIDTPQGLVVLVGCSHPGIAKMVEAAQRVKPGAPIRLVAGGFHMLKDSQEQIRSVVARLRELGVQSVMATHCTGEAAIAHFREVYGDRFLNGGAATRIPLD